MIDSRNEIIWLLEEYMVTQQEYISVSFGEKKTEWNGKREATYAFGIVLGKYQERDAATLQVIKKGVTNEALYNEIKANLEHEIKTINKSSPLDELSQMKLETFMVELDDLSIDSIDSWINKYCKWGGNKNARSFFGIQSFVISLLFF